MIFRDCALIIITPESVWFIAICHHFRTIPDISRDPKHNKMSDPFEAFDSNITATSDVQNTEDPAAEFLAQQQAEMEKIENNGAQFGDDGFGDFGGISSANPAKQEPPVASLSNGFDSSNDLFGAANGQNGHTETIGASTHSIAESKVLITVFTSLFFFSLLQS